jgi:PKD repeat protein
MDTAGCMSGGPVWLYNYWGNKERYIVTVHAYGRKGEDSNYGTRLTNNKFNDINDWLDEDSRSTDKPDLVDDGTKWAGFSPDPVTHGEELTVWNDVRNVGTASTGCFWVDYYASADYTISASEDYLIGYDQVCDVDPFTYKDAQSTLTISSDDVPSGDYVVGAIIDSQDDVDEFSESNNKMVITDDFLEVNARPDPSFAFSPTRPEIDETVSFDASGSSDSDGSVVEYRWDFDDDGTADATGRTPSHSFASCGKHTVTLTVTDDDGATATVSKTVSVNCPPSASYEYTPTEPNVDETVTFDGSASSDSDGSIVEYRWDFDGDGSTDATGSTVTHAFSSSGKYTVTLTVTDDDGATATVSKTVLVSSELPPVGDFENPPNDLDGDDKYEDVNGDETFDVVDVQALFANRDDSTITDNSEAFDFNDDGAINVVDVQRLFVMLTE